MQNPHSILQQYWGYSEFRPLQEDIIQAVLAGKDSLALLPTGGGKSICYQVPALCMDGICIVVSPLIALMKDQVNNLHERGIPCAAIFSGMSRREIDIVFENACNGAYKLLYLSPERLRTELAHERIKRMKVSLLAVDEAHCISQWGYDFRPPYLQIAELRELIPNVPVLALTATATKDVVEDIQDKLAFREKNVFQQSFARNNLSYSILYEHNKRPKLLDILKSVPGTGIVYVRSRGETKEIAQFLHAHRINADFYHAGLPPDERNKKQEAWMSGKTRIIVSTNAFGMGIDKPDVRIVVHLNLPDNLEAYFQEAGRAGRDGKKAYAVVLYAPADAESLHFQHEAAFPEMEKVRRVYQALGSYTQLAIGAGFGETFDFDLQHFCATYKLEQGTVHVSLKLLEQEAWVAISEGSGMPARVQILANRETLYDYQIRNKMADTLTKVLLRAYPGIQNDIVNISPALMAQYAKMPVEQVVQVLELAQKEGILFFQPQKDKPQLTFLKERVSAENLVIDQQQFQFRKQRAKERLDQAIRYAETRRCRNVQLLSYFGETGGKSCGICDVCTGRNAGDVPNEVFESLERKIAAVLKHESLPLEELLKAFAPKRHEMLAKVITYLLDEKKLLQDEDGKLSMPKS